MLRSIQITIVPQDIAKADKKRSYYHNNERKLAIFANAIRRHLNKGCVLTTSYYNRITIRRTVETGITIRYHLSRELFENVFIQWDGNPGFSLTIKILEDLLAY